MGFIGSLFGGDSGNSGGAGMNYQATGPNQGQMGQSIADTQTALQQQQMFLKALYSQNAIGNQQGVFNQQQALAGQLGQQAMGGGPNPAQAQFQQNANQVAAQAASLAGSQKGISPALQARMIAQQQAGAGQAAAGQAATLQAQQQIAAQQGLMQQQNAMANLSTQQVGQQQNSLNAYQQGALGQQSNMFGLQGSANSSNAGVAGQTAHSQGGLFGGILGGVGSVLGLAHGGQVPAGNGPRSACAKHFAKGGVADSFNKSMGDNDPMSAGVSSFIGGLGKAIRGAPGVDPIDYSSPIGDYAPGGSAIYQSPEIAPNLMNMHGGMQAGAYMAPNYANQLMAQPTGMFSKGGAIEGEKYAHKMKPVPGKAKKKGDSGDNDTVPAKLSPGEIIIPRSIAQHPNAPEMAAKFVAAIMAKNGRRIG